MPRYHYKQKLNPYRRCLKCNSKSHRRLWIEQKCPVCEGAIGFHSGSHGGLKIKNKREVETARAEIEKIVQETNKKLRF